MQIKSREVHVKFAKKDLRVLAETCHLMKELEPHDDAAANVRLTIEQIVLRYANVVIGDKPIKARRIRTTKRQSTQEASDSHDGNTA